MQTAAKRSEGPSCSETCHRDGIVQGEDETESWEDELVPRTRRERERGGVPCDDGE